MSYRAARGRRARMWRVGCIALAAAAVLVLGGIGALAYGWRQLDAATGCDPAGATVTVTRGEGLASIVDDLSSKKLIQSSFWFSAYAHYWRHLADNAVTGPHDVRCGLAANDVVNSLELAPDIPRVTVTFPEGLTARQMGTKLEQAGSGITADAYVKEVTSGSFKASFLAGRPPGASLEGFLFPDTYAFERGTTARQLVQMQLDDFAAKALPKLASPDGKLPPYQVLVLASIVEREARFAADRPQVAGVLVNRLNNGMLLQADATVSYGAGEQGEPSASDFKTDTPYNTYIHTGLPPTPISNPGTAAIGAAASPAQTGYLFYVSDACGHIHFATTEAEQRQNIARYIGTPC